MQSAVLRAETYLAKDAERIIQFTLTRQNPDGGFRGKDQSSDLYYTMFAVATLTAFDADFDREKVLNYLQSHEEANLDLVHLACLVRSFANLTDNPPDETLCERITNQLEIYRSADGGYSLSPNAQYSSAYACFLAIGLLQDLCIEPPQPQAIIKSLELLKLPNAAYTNDQQIPFGATSPTAAAVTTLLQLNQPIDPQSVEFLFSQCSPDGGFFAFENAPLPDLLSTATAIHTLSVAGADLKKIKEPCLDFVKSLWLPREVTVLTPQKKPSIVNIIIMDCLL